MGHQQITHCATMPAPKFYVYMYVFSELVTYLVTYLRERNRDRDGEIERERDPIYWLPSPHVCNSHDWVELNTGSRN